MKILDGVNNELQILQKYMNISYYNNSRANKILGLFFWYTQTIIDMSPSMSASRSDDVKSTPTYQDCGSGWYSQATGTFEIIRQNN